MFITLFIIRCDTCNNDRHKPTVKSIDCFHGKTMYWDNESEEMHWHVYWRSAHSFVQHLLSDPLWFSGYYAWLPSVIRRLRWIPKRVGPGRYINVRRCGGLSMVLLQLKDPLRTIREFLPSSGFLSGRNMT